MANEELSLKLRSVLAEKVGLDIDSATNDPDTVRALDETVKAVLGVVEERGDAVTENKTAEVVNGIDIGALTDAINARTAELKSARPAASPDSRSEHKVRADLRDAAKAMPDVIEHAKRAGGIFKLVTGGTPSLQYLISHPTTDDNMKMLQRANDDMLLLSAAMGVGTKDSRVPSIQHLDCWKSFAETAGQFAKAMNTTDGSAWTPTVYSDMFLENVYQLTNVAQLFPRFPWPGTGGTATVPAEGTDINVYASGEPTLDDGEAKFRANTPGVGTSVTVTAKTLASRVIVSWEMIEDSIIDVLDQIRTKIQRAHAFDLDDAIINGDSDGTHIDTGLSLLSDDRRAVFNGLRRKAIADTTTATDCATYANFEQFMAPLLLMGAYGQMESSSPDRASDTVFLCSHPTRIKMGWLRDTQNNNLFLVGQFPGAPYVASTGKFDNFAGFQRVASAKMPDNLNASGIYDGSTTTYSSALWLYVPAWHIYDKRSLSLAMVDRIEEGQRVMVGHQRLAFQHMYGDSAHTTSVLYGFKSTTPTWPA